MTDTKDTRILIDRQLVPDYYPEFRCTAQRCTDSCCVGWNINFGKRDFLAIRRDCTAHGLSETFGTGVKRIRKNPTEENSYAEFQLDGDGRCPFLAETGLCDMQLQCGGNTLPRVCREFPRVARYTPTGHQERSCSIGCGEVLYLLLARKEGLGFIEDPLPPAERRRFRHNWGPFAPHHADLQSLCIDVLQDRTLPLPRRMLLVGTILRDLSSPEYAEGLPNGAEWMRSKQILAASPEIRGQIHRFPGNQKLFLLNNVRILQSVASSNDISTMSRDIKAMLDYKTKLDMQLGSMELNLNLDAFQVAERAFDEAYGDLEYFFENILVNVFFHMGYPIADTTRTPWENWFLLCSFYSFIRFMAICCCHGGEEQLIHVLTMVARSLLHNSSRRSMIVRKFQPYDNRSLQDLAVLVCG